LVEPFLSLGTSLVRLEGVVKALTTSSPAARKPFSNSKALQQPSRTSHAVAASLSTFLAWVRDEVAAIRPPDPPSGSSASDDTPPIEKIGLLAVSSRLSPLFTTMDSLASLFSRRTSVSPPYMPIALSTPILLSQLHDHLQHHLEYTLVPPLMNQAVAAWLLHAAMREWWTGWEDWVGLGDGGTAWSELGIEMTKRTKKKDEKVFGEDSREDDSEIRYTVRSTRLALS
jgi:hypothetical protein